MFAPNCLTFSAGIVEGISGVHTGPGATAFTRIPCFETSFANAFVNPMIAALVGAVLQAASQRRVIVVDGFITGAAVLVAARLAPAVLGYCVWSHCSAESGHGLMIRHLGAQPLLDLGLRLGEGSGAALAWPLLDSAVRVLNDMASFESAGVSDRDAT